MEKYLDDAAHTLGIDDRPEVPIVRRIKPDERFTMITGCLRDAGFPVVETGPLSFYVDVPKEQVPAANRAQYVCTASYPPATPYLQPFGIEQYKAIYRYYTETLVPCLQDHDYPQSDPVPTEQTFLDTLGTADEWNPYNAVGTGMVGSAAWNDLQRSCPQQPPLDELYPPN